jgi:hypothetical protein
MSYFSKALSTLASERNRGIKELVLFSQLTAPYVYRLMTGETSNPSFVTIALLADALFMEPEEWTHAIGERNPSVDRSSPAYKRAWAKLLMAASSDAVAKSNKSRVKNGESF